MKSNQLEDATCQVKQAQAVLAMWLELATSSKNDITDKIGAIMTLLDGVPEVMIAANSEPADYGYAKYKGGKK
ncbi:hypothetical protein CEQ20_08590 [Yersinia pseudotuberculosis]|uniref:hypothetical protein n=1 Tax=Yersinia pseudotuberculosis TaxID=633 RepID=UPI00061C3452|nr:hypothetical protein [Yersinia pseudotuberculosis]AXY33468.1 hypothetical protein CEQ20_08590 [Yersinia pseudotuberculosis]PEI13043.1 hypothetical protein CRM78_07120 [Yersinia pseudotuberculosis]CNI64547.1 Uncharacterised protein [Yersinia pseudotuberculosis]CNJ06765.1 Uncharacterised protein [Yersinia pseudotuberculosis]SUQ17616.1 Uncharacterised protein [Yersinia pseudotuberculosis]